MNDLTDRQVREKLVSMGVGGLTDVELLSVLIRDGAAGESALEVARQLLESLGGSLAALVHTDIARLRMTKGLGVRRAATLAAAAELSQRIVAQEASAPKSIIVKEDVVNIFAPFMRRLKHEEMWALYLTSGNTIIEKCKVSQGGVERLLVDTRLVVKRALELLSSAFILVHNHPSGIAEPSPEDEEMTGRIAQAAAMFDIRLTDHIIIAGQNSYSFHQHSTI